MHKPLTPSISFHNWICFSQVLIKLTKFSKMKSSHTDNHIYTWSVSKANSAESYLTILFTNTINDNLFLLGVYKSDRHSCDV